MAEVGRSQGPCCPLLGALLYSFFPSSLFGNDLISSIINHLAAIVAELNPLNLHWDQPQGRRHISRKRIREKADGETAWEEVAFLHSTGHFPSAVNPISTAQRRVSSIVQTVCSRIPLGSYRRELVWQLFQLKNEPQK